MKELNFNEFFRTYYKNFTRPRNKATLFMMLMPLSSDSTLLPYKDGKLYYTGEYNSSTSLYEPKDELERKAFTLSIPVGDLDLDDLYDNDTLFNLIFNDVENGKYVEPTLREYFMEMLYVIKTESSNWIYENTLNMYKGNSMPNSEIHSPMNFVNSFLHIKNKIDKAQKISYLLSIHTPTGILTDNTGIVNM
jgi:hypothetical protein